MSLIVKTDIRNRSDLIKEAKRAFIDYVASLRAASQEPAVKRVAHLLADSHFHSRLLGQNLHGSPENAALFNGFSSHYLDYDDAQANLRGHLSVVLFSALLAVTDETDHVQRFLTAYDVGSEVEGLIGRLVNPQHTISGWHSTCTIGPLGAAAAIGYYKGLDQESIARLLSLAGTQSSGMGFQSGTDTKPLHAGIAAKNAVLAYRLLVEAGLSSSDQPFNNDNGWIRTFSGKAFNADECFKSWNQPGQILSPGLWVKHHPFCSAAMCGADAALLLWNKGIRFKNVKHIDIHYRPGGDAALKYHHPINGKQGKFSIEYIVWQILTTGTVDDASFGDRPVSVEFSAAIEKFDRVHDLPIADQAKRETGMTIEMNDGRHLTSYIDNPLGSPENPLSDGRVVQKLTSSVGEQLAKQILKVISDWPNGSLRSFLKLNI
ncbi:MAG: MmgE/PrpD family protein [Sporolactobacillus sp.]